MGTSRLFRHPTGNAASVRFIRNTPGLTPLAERQASKLRQTPLIERRLVQAIVAQASPLAGGGQKQAGTLMLVTVTPA